MTGTQPRNTPGGVSAAIPAPRPEPRELVLSERERQIINALRRIDFWRAGRTRMATLRWDGCNLIVFDAQQIT